MVASNSIAASRSVSSSHPATAMLVFLDGIVRVRLIINEENYYLGIRRGGQITNRVFRGNRDGRTKRIRVIAGSFSGREI